MKFLILLTFFTTAVFASSNFKNAIDGEYITVSGKVINSNLNQFRVRSQDKNITVTMDNYDVWLADGFKIKLGDKVIVTGRVDNDLLEKKTLDASSVYVQNIDSFFFGNSKDDRYTPLLSTNYTSIRNLPEGFSADITGKVTSISGRELTVDTGTRKVKVDTADMKYNPLDNKGFTKIQKGDRVTVSGIVQDEFFDSKELSAKYIIELSNTYSE